MKDNFLVVIMVILVLIMSGVALMFGIGNSVSVALAPLTAQVGELTGNQKNITIQMAQINQRLVSIESKLSSPGNAAQAAAPQPQQPQPPPEDMNKVYDINIGNSPVWGKNDAPVTIVEFSDLQCPFCSRFYPPIKEVMKASPDQVKFVIKNFPLSFHPNARPAAKLALAANEQGKYYDMVDLLLQNGASVEEAKVKDYAKTLKIDYKKLMDDYKNKDAEWEKRITEDTALGTQVNVMGTPTFFINGRKTNARDFNGYKTEIDSILSAK